MEEFSNDNILFNNRLGEFQAKKRHPNYTKYEGYFDLKGIFYLYSRVLHLKAKNYNIISVAFLKSLIEGFSIRQKIELLEYLIKCLNSELHIEEVKKVTKELKNLKIKESCYRLKKGESRFKEVFSLMLNLSSYNIPSLILSLCIILTISCFIYSNAPIDFMKVLEVDIKEITSIKALNIFLNVVLYTLDFDYRMTVKPINIAGVVLMVLLKGLFYLIVVNYIISEILKKIKQ